MRKTILLLCVLCCSTVSAQYFDWPQQQNQWMFQQQQPQWNFQQQQQYYQPQRQQQPQYNQQYQQQQYYPPQYQQQQVPAPAPTPVPAPAPAPAQQPPIYSQTVIIPQAPPPPPEAYQPAQYAPQQSAPIMVEAANIPRYHQKPGPTQAAQTEQQLQHIDRARSISSFDVDNRILREQPNSFAQNQEKTPKVRVTGGSVQSSSAAISAQQPQQQVQGPRIAPPQQVATPQQRPRPATRRPTPAVVRPQPVVATTTTTTIAPPVRSHLSPSAGAAKPKTASGKFLQCCQDRKVVKACERICSFDVLSKKTLTGMFLGTDPCPQAHGLDLMQCAADSDDHTACCIEKEVDRTSAGKKCLGFCNMKPGITFQADVSMLPCWSVLNDIKQCFKENLERQLAASA